MDHRELSCLLFSKNDQSAKYMKVSESILGHFLSALGQESEEAVMAQSWTSCLPSTHHLGSCF